MGGFSVNLLDLILRNCNRISFAWRGKFGNGRSPIFAPAARFLFWEARMGRRALAFPVEAET